MDNTRKNTTSEQQDLLYNHIGTLTKGHASLLDDFYTILKDKEQDEAKIRSMRVRLHAHWQQSNFRWFVFWQFFFFFILDKKNSYFDSNLEMSCEFVVMVSPQP